MEVREVHEAQASWLTKEGDEVAAERELLSAAFVYKTAADKTREFYPSNGLRFDRYKAFGGYFETVWMPWHVKAGIHVVPHWILRIQ